MNLLVGCDDIGLQFSAGTGNRSLQLIKGKYMLPVRQAVERVSWSEQLYFQTCREHAFFFGLGGERFGLARRRDFIAEKEIDERFRLTLRSDRTYSSSFMR